MDAKQLNNLINGTSAEERKNLLNKANIVKGAVNISYKDFDVNRMRFGKITEGKSKDQKVSFKNIDIRYDLGTKEVPNVVECYLEGLSGNPENINDLEFFDSMPFGLSSKTDEESGKVGKFTTIVFHPSNAERMKYLRVIKAIYLRICEHLFTIKEQLGPKWKTFAAPKKSSYEDENDFDVQCGSVALPYKGTGDEGAIIAGEPIRITAKSGPGAHKTKFTLCSKPPLSLPEQLCMICSMYGATLLKITDIFIHGNGSANIRKTLDSCVVVNLVPKVEATRQGDTNDAIAANMQKNMAGDETADALQRQVNEMMLSLGIDPTKQIQKAEAKTSNEKGTETQKKSNSSTRSTKKDKGKEKEKEKEKESGAGIKDITRKKKNPPPPTTDTEGETTNNDFSGDSDN